MGDELPGYKRALRRASERGSMSKMLGVILIVLGIAGLAWGGFTYTTKEKVLDIGPIEATRNETHNIPLPPIAGAMSLIGGIALLVLSGKQPARTAS